MSRIFLRSVVVFGSHKDLSIRASEYFLAAAALGMLSRKMQVAKYMPEVSERSPGHVGE